MSRIFLVQVLLVLATMSSYWQVTGHGFVHFDDPQYVFNNAIVRQGLTVHGLAYAFTTCDAANWHPVTWLSLMMDVELHRAAAPALSLVFARDENGLIPACYHLTNLLLYCANVLLLFGWLRSATHAVGRKALVAAALALHPMHVESVAWISEQKDVLSKLFMLLTLRAYRHCVRDGDMKAYLIVMLFSAF